MAVLPKRFISQNLSISTLETLYTVPENTTVIIKSLSVLNGSNTAKTFDLELGANHNFIFNHTIKPYDTLVIPCVDQVIKGPAIIRGRASGGNIFIMMSGKEVT